MTLASSGAALRSKGVPLSWDDPIRCVSWTDRFGRVRLIVGHFSNGRAATVRIDANGGWKTSFGAASVDTHPEGRDGEAGSVRSMGSAVPTQSGDAQTQSGESHERQ
jgi:hypothetical protein